MREAATEETQIPACMHLVQGGRWLLATSDTGSVTYFDLDASDPFPQNALIPDQFPSFKGMWTHMAVDVDRNTGLLAFNLALSFCTSLDALTHPAQHSIQIWKVMLLRDDRQRGIGLTAECLASFSQEPFIGHVYSLSLRGLHLALAVFCDELEFPGRAFVVDWLQANGNLTDYRRRLVNPFEGGLGPVSQVNSWDLKQS